MGGYEKIALIRVDKNMHATKLTNNMLPREIPRINKFICLKNENELNYVAVGTPNIGSRKRYIARFNFDGDELEFVDKIDFPDSTYVENYPMLEKQDFYGLTYDRKSKVLFKLNGRRIKEYVSMKNMPKFFQVISLEDSANSIYIVRKNRRLSFCQFKKKSDKK